MNQEQKKNNLLMIIQCSKNSKEIQKCFSIRSVQEKNQKNKKKIQQNYASDQNRTFQKHFTLCSNQFQSDMKASKMRLHIQSDFAHSSHHFLTKDSKN